MRFIAIRTVAIMVTLCLSVSATIISIPDDYVTIQEGIDASSDGDTVLVQPDIYYENINFNGHSIVLGSLFLTTQDTGYISQTIIDGDLSGTVITLESGEDSTTTITGFTIQNGFSPIPIGYARGGGIKCYSNVKIIGNIICDNFANAVMFDPYGNLYSMGRGGAIFCGGTDSKIYISDNIICRNMANFLGGAFSDLGFESNSEIVLINNNIFDNSAGHAGGAIFSNSSILIEKNNIYENIAVDLGGAISCDSNARLINNNIYHNIAIDGDGGGIHCTFASSPYIVNNIFYRNRAYSGGGIYCDYLSEPQIVNSVFWADSAVYENNEISGHPESNPVISYSNIQDTIWPGPGNISVDPLFRDPDNGDYHLMSIACGDSVDSPCIDTGDPFTLDSLLDCTWGLGEFRSDMGAYGGGDSAQVGIGDLVDIIPTRFSLSQNYPNPFNSSTVISYDLPYQSQVTIDIYDLLGRQVRAIRDGLKPAGQHQVLWNAGDLPSGVYFYNLQAGEYNETRKMVLIR